MDILPALQPGKIILVLGISNFLPALLAELSLRGPLTVLDAGNRFPAYQITREIRKRSPQVREAAERLCLRRAFTAYQTVHLLESTPVAAHPHILLNLLTPFQDAQIQAQEAARLLTQCLAHIERLSQRAPLAICLDAQPAGDFQRLNDRADQVFFPQPSAAQPSQPALFT